MKQESVTQQNSALVEQATAATLSFEEEATRLTEAVDRFKFARQVRVQAPQADRLPRPSGRPAAVRLGPIEIDQRPLWKNGGYDRLWPRLCENSRPEKIDLSDRATLNSFRLGMVTRSPK
jgi:hypothetical protein